MAEPVSAAAIGAVLVTKGIGFLYTQLGELLRRRRDRKDAAAKPLQIPSAPAPDGAPPNETVLSGQLAAGPVDEQALDQHAVQLAKLLGALTPYATGLVPADPDDKMLAEQAEAARRLLELVYRQHITFAGEKRPATGSPLGAQDAAAAGKYAAQVIASGERAVAIGGSNSGRIDTGDRTVPGAGDDPG
jgi:hypothetical protein